MIKEHRRRVGDTLTALSVTLQQPNESGVLAAVNLTGKTVSFKMVNMADGTTKVAMTDTGVTVVTAASGAVDYDFQSGGVDAAGVYLGTFVVTSATETDSFPVKQQELRIIIDSDTQTGEDAYEAAL